MTKSKSEVAREARLRRAARRQGLHLTKSSRRDPRALDYRRWYITDKATGALVPPIGANPEEYARRGASLDEVEAYLDRDLDDDEAERRVYCLTH